MATETKEREACPVCKWPDDGFSIQCGGCGRDFDEPLSSAEYVKAGGGVCPYCLGPNIEGDSIEIDGDAASQQVGCNDCGKTWIDVYGLEGFIATE